MDIHVRKAVEADIPEIHGIRNYYILHSNATVNERPRTLEDTAEWVRSSGQRMPFFVAEDGGEVVGYGALGVFRMADGYFRTAEVSLYVHHAHVEKGIGSALLQTLCEAAPVFELHCLVAVITADNSSSIRLHEKHGFAKRGTLPELAFKGGVYLDVVFMTKLT